MDIEESGRIADPKNYPGVKFGQGVVLYGKVIIKRGTRIDDYSILGKPTADHLSDRSPLLKTVIDSKVEIGAFCVIHNGVKIGPRVRVEERCNIGWNSAIGTGTRIIYSAQIHYKVKIGRNCIVGGFCCDQSRIGDNVIMFGKLIHKLPPDLIRKFKNPIRMFDNAPVEISPTIEEGAVIGFDAVVIGKVKVHSRVYIAANTIVTKDVPSKNIVVGDQHYTPKEWENKKRKDRGKKKER